jgi:hypothetical protein
VRSRLAKIAIASVLLTGCSVGTVRSEEATCDAPSGAYPVLAAQAVPSAVLLPCIRVFPAGWGYGGSEVRSERSRFWLDSDRAGIHAVEVSLTRGCSVAGLADVTTASGELDVRVFIEPITVRPFSANWHFVFPGGCVTYRYRFGDVEQAPILAFEADQALTFVPRSVLVDLVQDELGMTLCGAGAPPCVGED